MHSLISFILHLRILFFILRKFVFHDIPKNTTISKSEIHLFPIIQNLIRHQPVIAKPTYPNTNSRNPPLLKLSLNSKPSQVKALKSSGHSMRFLTMKRTISPLHILA